MTAKRTDVRTAFAALVRADLVERAGLLQAVYDHMRGDFDNQSPVVVVTASGTERTPFTLVGSRPTFLLHLFVFVLYAALNADGGLLVDAAGEAVWDEADSESALDDIEEAIRALVDGNQRGAEWKAVGYAGPSTADIIAIGGANYRREIIPLRFEAF